MGDLEFNVLVVDDDFRVASLHAGIVDAIKGFTVVATVNNVSDAHAAAAAGTIDLALVDVYLPDGSGVDLIADLPCDAMVLSATTEGDTIRAALAAGALSLLVKPFTPVDLAARLAGYARYRRILARTTLDQHDVDAALDSLHQRLPTQQPPSVLASPTKDAVLQALRSSREPMSSGEVSTLVGISRATAQRYLTTLAADGQVKMRLRYGTTGRPQQEFLASSQRR